MKQIRRRACSQMTRYTCRWGTTVVRKDDRSDVRLILRHTPNEAIPVTRQEAADGLRDWRKSLRLFFPA